MSLRIKTWGFIALISASCALSASQAVASGGSVKGGGNAVVRGERVELLDFVEQGLTAPVPFKPNPACDKIKYNSLALLKGQKPGLDRAVCLMLIDLSKIDPVFASASTFTIQQLTWASSELPLDDIDAEPLIKGKIVQLAIRTSNTVVVDASYFKKLSLAHQTGLIFHEVFAALISPKVTSPLPVRVMTANLFKPGYVEKDRELRLPDLAYFPNLVRLRENIESDYGGSLFAGPFDPLVGSRFFPRLFIVHSDATTQKSQIESLYLDETSLAKDSVDQFCTKPRTPDQSIAFDTTSVSIATAPSNVLIDGHPTSRYATVYNHEAYGVHVFRNENCTEDDASYVRSFQAWLASFKPILP